MQIGIWAKRKNKRAKKKGCKKNGYKMREFFVIRFSLFLFLPQTIEVPRVSDFLTDFSSAMHAKK